MRVGKKMDDGTLDVFYKPIPLPYPPFLQFEINGEVSLLSKVFST